MMQFKRLAAAAGLLLAALGPAWAGLGQPTNWELGFQQAASPVMEDLISFHSYLLYIISAIVALVLVLLLIIIVRFNAGRNPIPSRTSHNTALEIAWTVIPVLILVAIAIPSFRLLFYQLNTPNADLTVKVTGKQWFWTYSYPDNGKFEFDSVALKKNELKPDQPYLLAVDNEMVVPVNKVIRVQTTGADVIHAFGVPSFGVLVDAIPGRLNEAWFRPTREGIYYGQCRELCGKDHAYMPIAVRVVSEAAFNAWIEESKQKYADRGVQRERYAERSPTTLAGAE